MADLRSVKKRVTQNAVSIVLPRTSDGRHADYAPAVAMVLAQYVDDELPAGVEPGTPAWYRDIAMKEKLAHIEKMAVKHSSSETKEWWEGS
jgi:hypothetical protein